MGEYVLTTMHIGGKVRLSKLRELAGLADDIFDNPSSVRIDEALVTGNSVIFYGERNYGNADDIEDFCRKNGLTYYLHWECCHGEFEAGIHAWQPGMPDVLEADASNTGVPVIDYDTLADRLENGDTLEQIVHDLSRLRIESVPKLELTDVDALRQEITAIGDKMDADPLIKAAPEMLAALKVAEASLARAQNEYGVWNTDALRAVRAAIAVAETAPRKPSAGGSSDVLD